MLQQIKQITSHIQDITQEAADLQKMIKINMESVRIVTNTIKIKQLLDHILQKEGLLSEIQTNLCDLAALQCELQMIQYIINSEKISGIHLLQQEQQKIYSTQQNIHENESLLLKLSKSIQINHLKKSIESPDRNLQDKQRYLYNSISQYENVCSFMTENINLMKDEINILEKTYQKVKQALRKLTSITSKHTDYMKFIHGSNHFIDQIEFFESGNVSTLDLDDLQTPKNQINIELLKTYQINMRLCNKLKKEKRLTRQLQQQNQRLLNVYSNQNTKKCKKINSDQTKFFECQSDVTTRSL